MQGDEEAAVDRRWQASDDGRHYAAERWGSGRARGRDAALVARLVDRLPERPGARFSVLDVPCGTGRMEGGTLDAFERLMGARPTWTGVDVSASMLAQVPRDAGPRIRGSAAALPFTQDAFDVVLCCRLLHHYQGAAAREPVIRELFRVARRYVLLSYWDAASLVAWRRRTRGPLRRRKGKGVRHGAAWGDVRAQIEGSGGRVLRRAHSLRFVSAQTFVLAEVR